MSRTTTYVTLSGELGRETDKAILMHVSGVAGTPLEDEKACWIPLSQVQKIMRKSVAGEEDELIVTEWIAKTKELL